MNEKIALFVNKMPKFSGNLDDEDEVDGYIGDNFSKLSDELGIDLDDEKATEDAWKQYSELLNGRFGEQPDLEKSDAENASLEDDIAKFVAAMPPYTGDKEAESEIDDYANKAFVDMADELGIDLDDEEVADKAWQLFNESLDKKLEKNDEDLTSTGSTEEELDNAKDTTDATHATHKNILATLMNHRF